MAVVTINGYSIPLKGSLGTEFPNYADLIKVIFEALLTHKKSIAPLDIFIPEDGTLYFTDTGTAIADGDFKLKLDTITGDYVTFVRRLGVWEEYQRDVEDSGKVTRTLTGNSVTIGDTTSTGTNLHTGESTNIGDRTTVGVDTLSGKYFSSHTANSDSDHSHVYVTDTNDNSKVVSSLTSFIVNNLAPGESACAMVISIDDDGSSGTADSTSEIGGLCFFASGVKAATRGAIVIYEGYDVAMRVSGAPPKSLTGAYIYDTGSVVDRTTEFNTIGSDVTFFTVNNASIIIGLDIPFESIEFILDVASDQNVEPDFEYSTGNGTWAPLVITGNTTNNFQSISGQIVFTAPGPWATSNLFEGEGVTAAYYVKIKRTRVGAMTSPEESRVRVFEAGAVDFQVRGDGTIKPVAKLDADVQEDSIYKSLDSNKLVYKEIGGTVRPLHT